MNKKILYAAVIIVSCAVIVAAVSIFMTRGEKEPQNDSNVSEVVSYSEEVMEEKGLFEGKVICIDPGHGITSRREKEPVYPGAEEKKAANVSGASGKLMTEEELNLEVGLKLKEALEKEGAAVYITRTSHECDMSNIERAEFANSKKSDVVVRIHADGSESESVNGASVLVPSAKHISQEYLTDEIVQKSRKAGEYVLNYVCEKTGAKNRGIVERADMTGFNWSSVPVVLLEMGFISNREEEAKMAGEEYQQKIIEGIVSGLDCYFKETE